MPPKKKDGPSKKNEQKKKTKVVEDKTFGLKNKNKSKKVQQHIQSVTKSVMNTGDKKQRAMEEKRKKMKADAKMRKKAMKDEQDALFGDALLAITKKKSTNQKEGKTGAKGRDADEEGAKKGTSRAMKMMYQMDAQEMDERLKEDPNYVPTLEDKIESERQKKVAELKSSGKGTKVTEESFAAWQAKKQEKKAAQAKKLVEMELRKKKGGKGLSVLSGRALFDYKKDLFDVPDEEAAKTEVEDINAAVDVKVEQVAAKLQSDLFLEGDDDELDDLDDLDDE